MRGILVLVLCFASVGCGFLDDELAAELQVEDEGIEGLGIYGVGSSSYCGGSRSFSRRSHRNAPVEIQDATVEPVPITAHAAGLRSRAATHTSQNPEAQALDPTIALFVHAEKEVDRALKSPHARQVD